MKCPPKEPAPQPAPPGREDAIAMLMAPSSATTSPTTPQTAPKEPTVKAMPTQVADVQTLVEGAAEASGTAEDGSQQPGDTGPSDDGPEPGPPGPRDPPQFAPPLRYSQWPQQDEGGRWFADSPPDYRDIVSECDVRCPSCWVRRCRRINRAGHRRPHEKHLCYVCHAQHKALNPDEPTAT